MQLVYQFNCYKHLLYKFISTDQKVSHFNQCLTKISWGTHCMCSSYTKDLLALQHTHHYTGIHIYENV